MLSRRRRVLAALLTVVLGSLSGAAASPAVMHTGPAGISLIEEFEGYFPSRYYDPVGVVTQCFGATGAELATLPAHASRAQCRSQLISSLRRNYEPAVRALRLPLNQHQFDAAVSAVYNLGVGILARGRSFGDALRSRCWRCAADSLRLYVNAGGRVLAGLVRRREAERALFLRPVPVVMPGFSRVERVLILRFDRLARPPGLLKRRLKAQAARVQHAARMTGWDRLRRAVRYQSLRRRALT